MRWSCEDEDEAIGLELIFSRAGIDAAIVEGAAGLAVETPDVDADRALALLRGWSSTFARRIDHARREQLDRRERLATRSLGAAMLAVFFFALGWAWG